MRHRAEETKASNSMNNPCGSCGSPWQEPDSGRLVCCDCGTSLRRRRLSNPEYIQDLPAAVREQLRTAYDAMTAAGIDPGMPTADSFAETFYADEETHAFNVGCCDFADRPALVYAVTALRLLCAVEHQAAAELLELALAEIRNRDRIRA